MPNPSHTVIQLHTSLLSDVFFHVFACKYTISFTKARTFTLLVPLKPRGHAGTESPFEH